MTRALVRGYLGDYPDGVQRTGMKIRFPFHWLVGVVLILPPEVRAAVVAPLASWDHSDLYKLTATNRPPPPSGYVPRTLIALQELGASTPSNATMATLGAAVALYALRPDAATNSPESMAEAEVERRFVDMLKEVDRLSREGHAEEAIALLKQKLNQPMPPAQRAKINNRIASYFFRAQRYKEALPYMREAVRLDPQDYSTLCNLSAVLMSMNELREAEFLLKTLDISRIQDPRLLFSVFFNRACVASMQERQTQALEQLKSAAQTDPHSTLASLGDPQLDNVRPSLEFFDLKSRLETIISPTAELAP